MKSAAAFTAETPPPPLFVKLGAATPLHQHRAAGDLGCLTSTMASSSAKPTDGQPFHSPPLSPSLDLLIYPK